MTRLAKRMASLYDRQKVDTDGTIAALRLQAQAWRIAAIIATAEPDAMKEKIRWLLFKTVPFVDGEALRSFIEENEDRAAECGMRSGVFNSNSIAARKTAMREDSK